MFQVIYCYALGLVWLANAGEAQSPFLVAADWVLGVWFVLLGSFVGWFRARSE